MPLFAKLSAEGFLPAMTILAVTACVAAWVWMAARWRHGQPAVPYQPRRPAPWQGIDLTLIVAFYLAAQLGAFGLAAAVLGPTAVRPPDAYDTDKAGTEHAVAQVMDQGGGWVVLLCAVSVVAVAPVVEEFLFRLLFQGWLEALEHRWRRRMPTLGRLLPARPGRSCCRRFFLPGCTSASTARR